MRYAEKQLAYNLGIAASLLEAGRDIQFVKKLCNLTLVRMAKYGLIYELTVPDPRGFREDGSHDGSVKHTGQWRSVASYKNR